jgi:hypothetical protein
MSYIPQMRCDRVPVNRALQTHLTAFDGIGVFLPDDERAAPDLMGAHGA